VERLADSRNLHSDFSDIYRARKQIEPQTVRNKMKELAIPEAAKKDAAAAEILRVWLADGQQHITMRTGVFEDPAAWGLFLCDLARHIANAYKLEKGLEFEKTLDRVRAGFDAEMDSPTDMPEGGIVTN
jgi:hypothetical protein